MTAPAPGRCPRGRAWNRCRFRPSVRRRRCLLPSGTASGRRAARRFRETNSRNISAVWRFLRPVMVYTREPPPAGELMRLALLSLFASVLTAPRRHAHRGRTEDHRRDRETRRQGRHRREAVGRRSRVRHPDGPTDVRSRLKKLPRRRGGGLRRLALLRQGVRALKDLPHCTLVVEKAELGADAAGAIGRVELRHLSLTSCGVDDADLAAMKNLARLEHSPRGEPANHRPRDDNDQGVRPPPRAIPVQDVDFGQGLADLKPLDGLRTLSVRGTKVTSDAAESSRTKCPTCEKSRGDSCRSQRTEDRSQRRRILPTSVLCPLASERGLTQRRNPS